MKKLTFIGTLVLMLFLAACSDNSQDPIIETPLATYLENNPSLEFDVYAGDGSTFSLGYEFKASKNGKVTELGALSLNDGTFTVQIYLVDSVNNTGTLKGETTVTIAQADVDNVKFVFSKLEEAVSIQKGQYYRVAFSEPDNAASFYRIEPQASHDLPLQVTGSKVKISKGVYGKVNSFPDDYWDTMYTADVKIVF